MGCSHSYGNVCDPGTVRPSAILSNSFGLFLGCDKRRKGTRPLNNAHRWAKLQKHMLIMWDFWTCFQVYINSSHFCGGCCFHSPPLWIPVAILVEGVSTKNDQISGLWQSNLVGIFPQSETKLVVGSDGSTARMMQSREAHGSFNLWDFFFLNSSSMLVVNPRISLQWMVEMFKCLFIPASQSI